MLRSRVSDTDDAIRGVREAEYFDMGAVDSAALTMFEVALRRLPQSRDWCKWANGHGEGEARDVDRSPGDDVVSKALRLSRGLDRNSVS